MSRSRRITLIIGLVLLLTAGIAGFYLLTHEPVSKTVEVGPSGRAVRDPFWAAALLLEEMGVPTDARYGLGELPAPASGSVVVVLATDPNQRAFLADRLVSWVDQGGHLVLAPGADATEHWDLDDEDGTSFSDIELDPLLNAFGVIRQTDGDHIWRKPTVVTVERSDSDEGVVDTLVTRARQGVYSHYCAAVIGEVTTGQGDDAQLGARTQLRARCIFGTGLVTAVSSTDLFENNMLQDARGDNAAFFWDSVAHDGPPTRAIFVLRGDAPSFFALLWGKGWPFILSLVFTLVGWAVWQGQRFGPIRDRPALNRRSMMEHLDAAGSLMWRHRQVDGLSGAMRRAVRGRLTRRNPSLARLHGDPLAEAVAELTGHPVDTIRQVLVAPAPTDRRAFIEMVKTLQSIWREASPTRMRNPT